MDRRKRSAYFVSRGPALVSSSRALDAIFETARLRARKMTLADLDFIASLLADEQVMRFYPKRYTRDDSRAWVERQLWRYEEHGHGLWLIIERASGEPVGQVGLLLQAIEGSAEPEVGYLMDRRFWRRGYATEAAIATRDYAFSTLGLPRIVSLIRPENIPSQGVATKMGMQRERTVEFAGMEHWLYSVSNSDVRGVTI